MVNGKCEKFLFLLAKFLGSSLILGLAAILILQVICRYSLHISFSWAEELVRYAIVWLTFCGSIALSATGSFSAFSLGNFDKLPVIKTLVNCISSTATIAFFLCLSVGGTALVGLATTQTSAAMGISMRVVYVIIPVSGVLSAVAIVYRIIEKYLKYKARK